MEPLLDDLGTCGRFQVIFVIVAHLPKSLLAFSVLFMSFGNYNPGWRCLDNITHSDSILNNSWSHYNDNDTPVLYTDGTCQLYESCRLVQFNPESSTVVTEWNLLCRRSWIASLITSTQMFGVLVGAYFTGYMGDRFGRKYTLLPFVFVHGVLNLIALFSVSWSMFAVLGFFIGVMCSAFGFMPMVFCSEFTSSKWRAPIASIPGFGISGIFFAICAMITKDWKQIIKVNIILSAICFIVMAWLPRSIRWLAVHNQEEEVFRVTKKVARINRKPQVPRENVQALIEQYKNEDKNKKNYSFLQLFRKGARMYSSIIAGVSVTLGLTYYVLSFGVKSLPGDIYTNLIIILSVDNISNIFSSVGGNFAGRRKTYFVSFIIITTSLLGVVAVTLFTSGQLKDTATVVLAIIARVFTSVAWFIMTTYMVELFPTVVRSSVSGWGGLNCAIGATIAPFLVSDDPGALYISYLVMGGFNLMCCFFFFVMPETAGTALQDTWGSSITTEVGMNLINVEHLKTEPPENNTTTAGACL